MKFYPKFKIRVVYKSGYHHDFWVWKFSCKLGGSNSNVTWNPVKQDNKPLDIASNLEHIESVWQIGVKQVFRFSNPVKD